MPRDRRRRFALEVTLASVSAALFVLTLVRRDWIEALAGLDPDGGSGAAESTLAATFAALALAAGWLARREWRRALEQT